MKALITGATSGIGKAIAQEMSRRGISLILTGRNEEALLRMQETLPVHTEIIALDLAENQAPFTLYEFCRDKHVDILVNNAGFGVFGKFSETALQEELELLQVNVRALHILTKLFLRDFKKRNFGKILNVASSAGFLTGPLFSSYYASKNYGPALAGDCGRTPPRKEPCHDQHSLPRASEHRLQRPCRRAVPCQGTDTGSRCQRSSVRAADRKAADHSGADDACRRCRIKAGAGKTALPYPLPCTGSKTAGTQVRHTQPHRKAADDLPCHLPLFCKSPKN